MDALLSTSRSNTRIVVHNEAGLVYPLPYAYLQKIRAQPGVVVRRELDLVRGVFAEEKAVEFPNFAVESRSARSVGQTGSWPAAARSVSPPPRRCDRRAARC